MCGGDGNVTPRPPLVPRVHNSDVVSIQNAHKFNTTNMQILGVVIEIPNLHIYIEMGTV
jgi:hypothetical protein